MCVIQGNTKSVADTEIFCAPCANGKDQVTVYSNAVSMHTASNNNAMILPVPGGADRFSVIDLSRDPDMFKKIESCFPQKRSLSMDSLSTANSATCAGGYLAVKQCGSYQYSLVPSIEDFGRVDPRAFQLSPDVRQLFLDKYPRGYAFLVCKISDNKKFHPVGYVHPLPAGGKLFVPTLHFHQGHNHNHGPDWDHSIYVLGNDTFGRPAATLNGLNEVAALRPYLSLTKPCRLRKAELHGHFPNRDIGVPTTTDRSWLQMVLAGV